MDKSEPEAEFFRNHLILKMKIKKSCLSVLRISKKLQHVPQAEKD